jgi:hypothetical protein
MRLALLFGATAACVAACSSAPAHDSSQATPPGGDAAPASKDARPEAGATDTGQRDGGAMQTTGKPGCGLALAAFCDTFDTKATVLGRAGELDARSWSGSRLAAQGPTTSGEAFGVASATLRPMRLVSGASTELPACRAGIGATVSSDDDALLCDPAGATQSPHLLVAVAAQNYGVSSYRIRQPFDFEARTGTIVFDAEALAGGLLGGVSIEVTEDPIGVPGFSIGQGPSPYPNDEGTPLPKNGFELQLNGAEGGGVLSLFATFDDYVETDSGSNLVPIATEWGALNHFEVEVSTSRVDLYASPASADGRTFAPRQHVFGQAVSLPFSRGWVHVSTHNHATLKYSASSSAFGDGFTNLDAWMARWDNVGFDGPVVGGWREVEVADSRVPFTTEVAGDLPVGTPVTNLGWTVPDAASGTTTALHLKGVDPSGMTSARVALTAWYCLGCGGTPSAFDLRWRLNGQSWHDRTLEAGESAYLSGGASQGALAEMIDVPMGELVSGDNTLELATSNVPQNYPPGVTNVDLVMAAE